MTFEYTFRHTPPDQNKSRTKTLIVNLVKWESTTEDLNLRCRIDLTEVMIAHCNKFTILLTEYRTIY